MDDTSFIYLIGLAGNLLFGFKSLPQVIRCFKQKTLEGVSKWMLICDLGGNLACTYFIFATTGFTLFPQFINYFFATLFLIVLLIMAILYRRK